MIKLIVFDFDGTLADTKKMLLNIIQDNVEHFNYKIDDNFIKHFGDKPLGATLKQLKVSEKVLPYLIDKIGFDFLDYIKHVRPAKNIHQLKKINKNKVILSNSIAEFITVVLKRMHVNFFKEVIGSDNFNPKYKSFLKILKKYKVKPKEVVYIGDRAIDTVLARKIKCYSVIVCNKASWAYPHEIIASKPDYIISDLGKLKNIINRLDSKS